jgi:hypothetical protein
MPDLTRYRIRLTLDKRSALWERLHALSEAERRSQLLHLVTLGLQAEAALARLLAGGSPHLAVVSPPPPPAPQVPDPQPARPAAVLSEWEFDEPH